MVLNAHKINVTYLKQVAIESHMTIDMKKYFRGLKILNPNDETIDQNLQSTFFHQKYYKIGLF